MNKRTDKQYVAVLLLHNTTNPYQALYHISESLLSLLKWLLRNLWQKKMSICIIKERKKEKMKIWKKKAKED